MSLADRLSSPPKDLRAEVCGVGRLLDTLKGADLDALKTALLDHGSWQHNALAREILAEHPTFASSEGAGSVKIGRHRRGQCNCEPR